MSSLFLLTLQLVAGESCHGASKGVLGRPGGEGQRESESRGCGMEGQTAMRPPAPPPQQGHPSAIFHHWEPTPVSAFLHLCPRRWPRRAEERDPGHAPAGAEDLPQWDASLSCSRVVPDIPWRQMGSPGRTTALLGLSLILLLRSQGPGVQGQEFRFGPCRVQGVALQELREAFWTVKDTVVSDVLPRVSFWARLWGFPWVRDSIV